VFVGDLVSFYTAIVKSGRTSITIDVEVYAQRHRIGSEVVKVTEAQLTYVAIDDEGNPRVLPAI
jgi:acyl-CoA thioesterase YciA